MHLIETYRYEGPGYNPFLIRTGWQAAQLNYTPEQDISNISKIDKHFLTDEVFVLLKGTAILIAATESDNGFEFECMKMRTGEVYNVPATTWHNIAMDKGSEVIIFEKDNTHLGDFEYNQLSDRDKRRLKDIIIASKG